jgi:hypothetical protein
MRTAGKITIVTALAGLLVFMVAFIFDVGTQELSKVSAAGNASTTLTVLNTPPTFTVNPYEVIGSSTTTPTNSGVVQQWSAIGTDANAANYYLLICSNSAAPTPNNSAAPDCDPGAIQWGVSASTVSGALATVSTTTVEVGLGQFAEVNNWWAWVCDGDAVDPRCIVVPEQGDYATSSSPFNVNDRPVLTNFGNNGPVDPAGILTFLSTSTDPDVVGGEDKIYLVVCGSASYSTVTNTCSADFLASTTISILSDASATYTLAAIVRDDTYGAYAYLVDEHGHEAVANPINVDFDVNNVPPTVLGGDIFLYGDAGPGTDLVVSVPAGETPSSTVDFTIRDANSCVNAVSGPEITDFKLVVFRSGVGTSTCDGTGANYDPNNCYDNAVPSNTWNISCTATTTCAGPLQDYMDYTCDFPLWFLADPTDNGANTPAALEVQNWSVGIAGIDDDAAEGAMSTTSSPKELISFSSIDILAAEIAYGGIEPGFDSGTLSATSTALNVGNTGLDQEVQGESMCGTFSVPTPCAPSATSTIPENQQHFSSTSLAYGSPLAVTLASTSYSEVELNIQKTTSTTSLLWKQGKTYWGIAVPIAITLAGSYTGLNTFIAKTAEAIDW